MPANRSRTLEWRRCLKQVHERGGSLEIALARKSAGADDSIQESPESVVQSHLMWRVRILSLTDAEILVEQPSTLGQVIEIERGMNLVVILSIGQNRWMFNASCLGGLNVPGGGADRRGSMSGLRLSMPDAVQRCQRRNHYRMDTPVNLPRVDVWPLLDARSVVPAERAHEIQFEIDMGRLTGQMDSLRMDFESVMPEVGPKIGGTLLNLGGGGMGLRVEPQDATILNRHKLFWLRFNLPPALKTPICASAKLVHTHMESTQDTYAGMAFDFSFNPSHQKFVVDQICRYIAMQQREQTREMQATQRRTA